VIESSSTNSTASGSKKGSAAPAAVAFPEPADMRQLQNSSKYQECILAAQNDPLVSELQEKAAKFQTMFNARQKHDQEVTKKLNAYISEAIGNYAASNSFELVISRSEREVLYNKTRQNLILPALCWVSLIARREIGTSRNRQIDPGL
jgi:hypothetical protein